MKKNTTQSLDKKINGRGGYMSPLVKSVRITARQCFMASTTEKMGTPDNWNTINDGWDE